MGWTSLGRLEIALGEPPAASIEAGSRAAAARIPASRDALPARATTSILEVSPVAVGDDLAALSCGAVAAAPGSRTSGPVAPVGADRAAGRDGGAVRKRVVSSKVRGSGVLVPAPGRRAPAEPSAVGCRRFWPRSLPSGSDLGSSIPVVGGRCGAWAVGLDLGAFRLDPGDFWLDLATTRSPTLRRAVPWARCGFTAEFGMGSGGARTL